jgi:hypothetical protein
LFVVPVLGLRNAGQFWQRCNAKRPGVAVGLSLPISYAPRLQKGTERDASQRIGLLKGETIMRQSNHDPKPAEAGEQVPARPHDSGSAANETVDGLDATTEALRHAAEDTPSGAGPDKIEKTPVFDRAGAAPKI